MTASIVFLCEHGQHVSKPRASMLKDSCQVEVEWRTELACPPHQEVQCSLSTPAGQVDLSSLSLPGDNYQVMSEGGGEFSINVCRSLVHSGTSHCPYSAAACFTKTVNGTTDGNNLGELSSGPQLDPNGKVFISYKLGSVCLHPNDNRNHIETVIYFECAEQVTGQRASVHGAEPLSVHVCLGNTRLPAPSLRLCQGTARSPAEPRASHST